MLSDAAEEEGAQLDLGDQMSITRFLRAKVCGCMRFGGGIKNGEELTLFQFE